ncbi:MAG TPA: phosphonate ABC transporter, permease protein PhnE [Chloroflexia bacterium]|nr:phosphonate ABC transporter, permease protein PhnE [Chloroflexia bacterium]
MATIDNPAPNPRPMTVAERQGTAKEEAARYPLPVLRVLQGVWGLWLIACILLFIPYLPGVFGGTAFLFANFGSMVFGGFSGIFSGISSLTVDNLLLPPWLGLSAETEKFIIDGWLAPIIIIIGTLLIGLLWRASRTLPQVARIPLRMVAVFIGIIVGLEALMLLSYPLALANSLFTNQEKWYSIPITIVGAAIIYFLWKLVDNLPVALHGIGRFLTALLAAVVVMEFLVVLSYPLEWLRELSVNLLNNIPADFMSNFLRSWWLPILVIIVGSFLIWLLWNSARSLAGIVIAGLLLWAHMFGWQVSRIEPQVLVEKAPKTQQIVSDLLQPNIVARDEQVLELQAQSVVGVETPPQKLFPVTIESQLTSSLVSKRPNEAGDIIVPPKDESESFNLKVDLSTDSVAPGQPITIKGTGFRANTPGLIRWQSTGVSASVQDLGTFTPDAQGNFESTVQVPDDPERVINLSGSPNTIAFTQKWPSGELYFTDTFRLVRDAIIETIFLALMGTTVGVILSIPLSFMASQNLMSHNVVSKTVYVVTRTILNILRSVEVVIWAIIFVAAVGLGPFAGMLALAIHSIASLGKLYSEAIEAIDPGPIEAITATGANRLQVIRYAVIPQFIPQFVSFTLYRWDINVRMATIIGIVGGGGIGLLLSQYINILDWNAAGTAILFIAIIVIAMDYASSKIRAAVV